MKLAALGRALALGLPGALMAALAGAQLVCSLGCPGVGAVLDGDRWATLAQLSSPNATQRAQAVRRIGQRPDREDLGALVARVGDPEAEVRAAVAEALGHCEERRAVEALGELLNDGAEPVRLQAVSALGQLGSARARGYLLAAYPTGSAAVRVRLAAVLAAGDGGSQAVAEAVAAEARAQYARYARDLGGAGAERLAAAEGLGRSGRPEAVERLSSYLGAEFHPLAEAAARGLGGSGLPAARLPLEALLTEDDPALQIAGAQALGELGDLEAAPALSRQLLRGGSAARASLVALRQLVGAGPQGQQWLCAAALAPAPEVAGQAGRWVRAAGRSCALPPFLAALRRGADAVGALAGLAELGDLGEVADGGLGADRPRLVRALSDAARGAAAARPWAVRAAGALGLTELAPEVRRALEQADRELRRARARWVEGPAPDAGDQGDAAVGGSGGAGPAGLPSLFSPDPPQSLALWSEAALASLRLGTPDGRALWDRLRADPAPRARLAAVDGVAALPLADRWKGLLPLLTDGQPEVREAAVRSTAALAPEIAEAGPWLLAQLGAAAADADLQQLALVTALGARPRQAGLVAALEAVLNRPAAVAAAARALAAEGSAAARAAIARQLERPGATGLAALLDALAAFPPPVAPAPAPAAEPRAEAPATSATEALGVCRSLLFHPLAEVRAAAARALWAQAGNGARRWVEPLRADYDQRVRRAARGPGP